MTENPDMDVLSLRCIETTEHLFDSWVLGIWAWMEKKTEIQWKTSELLYQGSQGIKMF